MRISEIFELGRSQHELDFVDINPSVDAQLYLDPFYLRHSPDAWCRDAYETVQDFWSELKEALESGDDRKVHALLGHLHEPNETCLGQSLGRPRGRGVGDDDAARIVAGIIESEAIQKRLVEDIEDIRFLVNGIGKDKLSDMVTNIIRGHLIQYTQEQCDVHDIALNPDVITATYWDRERHEWVQARTHMLLIDDRPVLLVPKSALTRGQAYNQDEYHRQFALPYLQGDHLRRGTHLVQEKRLKIGIKRWVNKKDLIAEEAPNTLDFLLSFTADHPEVFQTFKTAPPPKRMRYLETEQVTRQLPPASEDSAETSVADTLRNIAEHLITELATINPGHNQATDYERLCLAATTFVFYPRLLHPQHQEPINQGRKVVDLCFMNGAKEGFFSRQILHGRPAEIVFAECKNYSDDPANRELDQLFGRLNDRTSRLGFFFCRTVDHLNRLLNRCHDGFAAGNGLVLPITDEDLVELVRERSTGSLEAGEVFLVKRMKRVTLG